jgi:hypothetical protein
MKAATGLLAVLLLLSSPSLGQTASVPLTVPAQPTTQAPLAAGAKLFLEPMGGFERFLSDAIVKKKVPVVLVGERAKADFVLSGGAHVKKRGFFTGFVMDTHGGGNIAIQDARTGNQVFAYKFHRVNQGTAAGYVYQSWADACAKHLKKALEKK